jgi:hypothetical protein
MAFIADESPVDSATPTTGGFIADESPVDSATPTSGGFIADESPVDSATTSPPPTTMEKIGNYIEQLPGNVVKGIKAMAKNPVQATAGIASGALTTGYDLLTGRPVRQAAGEAPTATDKAIDEFYQNPGSSTPLPAGQAGPPKPNWTPAQTEAFGAGATTGSFLLPGVEGLAPAAKAGTTLAKIGVGGAKDIAAATGKKMLSEEINPTRGVLNKMGNRSLVDAKAKIEDTIVKHNLESPSGGIKGVAKNAAQSYTQKNQQAKSLISDFVEKNPETKVNMDNDVYGPVQQQIYSGTSPIAADDIPKAQALLDKIRDAHGQYLNAKGDVTLDVVDKVRQDLQKSKDLYNKPMADEALTTQVKQMLSNQAINQIGKLAPAAGQLRRDARDIEFVRKAADIAAAKKQPLITADIKGGLAGTIGAAALEHPHLAIGAGLITLSDLAAKKFLGKGKFASMLIKAGRKSGQTAEDVAKFPEVTFTPYVPGGIKPPEPPVTPTAPVTPPEPPVTPTAPVKGIKRSARAKSTSTSKAPDRTIPGVDKDAYDSKYKELQEKYPDTFKGTLLGGVARALANPTAKITKESGEVVGVGYNDVLNELRRMNESEEDKSYINGLIDIMNKEKPSNISSTPNFAIGTFGENHPIVYKTKSKKGPTVMQGALEKSGIKGRSLTKEDKMGHNAQRSLVVDQKQNSPMPPPESGRSIGKQPYHGTSEPHRFINKKPAPVVKNGLIDFGPQMRPKGIRGAASKPGVGSGWGGSLG